MINIFDSLILKYFDEAKKAYNIGVWLKMKKRRLQPGVSTSLIKCGKTLKWPAPSRKYLSLLELSSLWRLSLGSTGPGKILLNLNNHPYNGNT